MVTPNSPITPGTAGPVQPPDAAESRQMETPTAESSASAQPDTSFWVNYALIASGVATLTAVSLMIWGVGADNVTLVGGRFGPYSSWPPFYGSPLSSFSVTGHSGNCGSWQNPVCVAEPMSAQMAKDMYRSDTTIQNANNSAGAIKSMK